MADVVADVVTVQAAGGVQDVVGDLGGATPKFVLVNYCGAITKNAVNNHGLMGHGYFVENFSASDIVLANSLSQSHANVDGLGTSYLKIAQSEDLVGFPTVTTDTNWAARAAGVPIADGIRLTWDTTPPPYFMSFLFLGGADFSSNGYLSGNEDPPYVHDFTFPPELILSRVPGPFTQTLQAQDVRRIGTGPSFGLWPCSNSGNNHFAVSHIYRNNRSSAQRMWAIMDNDIICSQTGETDTPFYTKFVDSVAGSNVTFDNRNTRARNTPHVGMNFGGNGVDSRIVTAPGSPGQTVVSGLSFDPAVLLIFSNGLSTFADQTRNIELGYLSLAIKKKGEPTASVMMADLTNGNDPVSKSYFYDTHDYVGRSISQIHWEANITLDSGGYTIDWETLASFGAGAVHCVVAIEATLGGVGPGPIILNPLSSRHGQLSAAPPITQAHLLTALGSKHGHRSEVADLLQAHILGPEGSKHGHRSDVPDLLQASLLDPEGSKHGHRSDAPTITQAHVLGPEGSKHGHRSEAPNLSTVGLITPLSSKHVQRSDEPGLQDLGFTISPEGSKHEHRSQNADLEAVKFTIVVESSRHGQKSGAPSLTAEGFLTVLPSRHGQRSGEPDLTQAHTLAPEGSKHGHRSEAPSLGLGFTISPEGTVHAQRSGEPGLELGFFVSPEDVRHAQRSGEPVIIQAHILAPEGSRHAQRSGEPFLVEGILLVDDDRVILVEVSDRVIEIPFKDLTIEVE